MKSPDMIIRHMQSEDVPTVAAIEMESFPDPWPPEAFTEILSVATRLSLVAEVPGSGVVGYLLAQRVASELQIHNVAVTQAHRRKGHGRKLLREAERIGSEGGAEHALLDVRESNTVALALYRSFGYRMISRRRSYYRLPACDALVLCKSLSQPMTGTMETTNGMVP